MPIDNVLTWVAVLIFISVVSSKLSDKFAIPVLLLFLAIGMLAGSIVSYTDAPAVFSILRSRRTSLKKTPKAVVGV